MSSSGALSTGQTRICWSGAGGCHSHDPRAGTPLLARGKAERAGLAQPGARRLQADLIAAFQYLRGPARNLEGDFLQGRGVIGQGTMALN